MSRSSSFSLPPRPPVTPTQYIPNGLPSPPGSEGFQPICDNQAINHILQRLNHANHAAIFSTQLCEAKKQLGEANRDAEACRLVIKGLEKGKAHYENQFAQAEEAKQKLRQERDRFEREAAVSAEQLKDARKLLAEFDGMNEDLKRTKQELAIMKTTKDSLAVSHQQRCIELERERNTLSWTSQELRSAVMTAANVDGKLHSGLWKLEFDNAELRKDIGITLGIVDELRDELEYQKANLLEAKDRASQLDKRNGDLQTQFEHAEATLAEQKTRNSVMQKELEAANATIAQLRLDLCTERDRTSDRSEVRELEAEKSSLALQLKDVREELSQETESRKTMSDAHESLKKEFTALKTDWRKIDRLAKQLHDRKESLKVEVHGLRKEKEDLQVQVNNAVQEKDEMQGDFDAIKARLKRKEATWNQDQACQERHMKELQGEVWKLREQVPKLQTRNEELREKHASQREKIRNAEQRAEELQKEIEERDEVEKKIQGFFRERESKKRGRTESLDQCPTKRQKMDHQEI